MGIRNKKVMRTRTLFCGLSLMMATLGFVACTEEHVENITNEDNNNGNTNAGDETKLIPMTFTAVGSNCSRTELQSDNSVYWSPGDSICVFTTKNLEAKYLFVTDINQVSPTASFHGEIEESDTYIAFYPYPRKGQILSFESKTTNLRFNLPEVQRAVNGTFDKSLNPSLAFADGENNLVFKNLCSLMKFQFTGSALEEVRKITITDRNNTSMNILMRYDVSTGKLTAVYPNEPSISIGADKFEDMGVYYFVIPLVEGALSNGFTISFYNEEGLEICSKRTSTPIELAPGKLINMGKMEVVKDGVDYEIAEDGTYLVYKASGLKAWADHVNAGNWSTNVTLMNDITFDVNEYWKPIGNTSNSFTGIFDGNGKTIKGLKIQKSGIQWNGIIGSMEGPGEIRNLTVESPVCYGGTYLSVLVARCGANSRIINCHVNNAELECSEGGSSGIICGGLYNGYIEGCTATGNVTGIGVKNIGGLVGEFYNNGNVNPIMVCSSFEGTVTGNSENYGGLIGYMVGKIEGCYAVASVTGAKKTGGLIGNVVVETSHSGSNYLSASYFKGSVTCSDASAGLIVGNIKDNFFIPSSNAYYYQDGENVTVAAGNKIEFAGFKAVSNWEEVISDMNSKIGDTYKYEYVWDETKQHPVLQATE